MKEWQKHIADRHVSRRAKAWCGATLAPGDWAFVDVDHAALNGRQQGRQVPCPQCRDAVISALKNGAEENE